MHWARQTTLATLVRFVVAGTPSVLTARRPTRLDQTLTLTGDNGAVASLPIHRQHPNLAKE